MFFRESYPELIVMKIYKALYEDAPDFPEKLEYYFHGILRYNIHARLMQCHEEFSQSNIISLLKGLSTDTSYTTFDKMLVKRSIPIRELFRLFFCFTLHIVLLFFILLIIFVNDYAMDHKEQVTPCDKS